MIGLNVGSGERRFESTPDMQWVNIDCVSRPPGQVPDLLCDVGKQPLPYPDDSVDHIVLSHIIEHFGCGEADLMIRECYRVLKPGGSLIAAVPDLMALSMRWQLGQIDEFIYMINSFGPYQGEETDRHKWGYSQRGLLEYIKGVSPWVSIKKFDWKKIPNLDLARDWWIASAEAIK